MTPSRLAAILERAGHLADDEHYYPAMARAAAEALGCELAPEPRPYWWGDKLPENAEGPARRELIASHNARVRLGSAMRSAIVLLGGDHCRPDDRQVVMLLRKALEEAD